MRRVVVWMERPFWLIILSLVSLFSEPVHTGTCTALSLLRNHWVLELLPVDSCHSADMMMWTPLIDRTHLALVKVPSWMVKIWHWIGSAFIHLFSLLDFLPFSLTNNWLISVLHKVSIFSLFSHLLRKFLFVQFLSKKAVFVLLNDVLGEASWVALHFLGVLCGLLSSFFFSAFNMPVFPCLFLELFNHRLMLFDLWEPNTSF